MYGKLFSQMYEGTLASKGPWEALVTFQQLIILANKHGEVDMTPDALSRRTTIPFEIIARGLGALSEPDPDSRSPELEGRRIVLLDSKRAWGWRIVNYEKYRKIRSDDERREYQRTLMASRRAKKLAPVSNVSPSSKQYAEVEVEKTKHFGVWWNSYPRKVGKAAAQKLFRTLSLEEENQAMSGLKLWCQSEQWNRDDGKYIPYASTFLAQKRYLDEPWNGAFEEKKHDPTHA